MKTFVTEGYSSFTIKTENRDDEKFLLTILQFYMTPYNMTTESGKKVAELESQIRQHRATGNL